MIIRAGLAVGLAVGIVVQDCSAGRSASTLESRRLTGNELRAALSGHRFFAHTSDMAVSPYFEEYYADGPVRIGGDPGTLARYIVDDEEFCVLSKSAPKLCRTLELVDDTRVYFVESRGKDEFRTLFDRRPVK